MSNIDKTAIRKTSIDKQDNDYQFWITKSAEDRLAALESMRKEYSAWRYNAEQRLQRVYKIIKQK